MRSKKDITKAKRRQYFWLIWDVGFFLFDVVLAIYYINQGMPLIAVLFTVCAIIMALVTAATLYHLNWLNSWEKEISK